MNLIKGFMKTSKFVWLKSKSAVFIIDNRNRNKYADELHRSDKQ